MSSPSPAEYFSQVAAAWRPFQASGYIAPSWLLTFAPAVMDCQLWWTQYCFFRDRLTLEIGSGEIEKDPRVKEPHERFLRAVELLDEVVLALGEDYRMWSQVVLWGDATDVTFPAHRSSYFIGQVFKQFLEEDNGPQGSSLRRGDVHAARKIAQEGSEVAMRFWHELHTYDPSRVSRPELAKILVFVSLADVIVTTLARRQMHQAAGSRDEWEPAWRAFVENNVTRQMGGKETPSARLPRCPARDMRVIPYSRRLGEGLEPT